MRRALSLEGGPGPAAGNEDVAAGMMEEKQQCIDGVHSLDRCHEGKLAAVRAFSRLARAWDTRA